jgi:quinol monooxygenase YgiN
MSIDRRTFVAGAASITAFPPGTAATTTARNQIMYGLISRITAQSGRRDELVKILLAGMANSVAGCLNYIIAIDPSEANSIWVTEVWQSRQAHAAALSMPAVKEAVSEGRPLIASFLRIAETAPVGGLNLVSQRGDKFLP